MLTSQKIVLIGLLVLCFVCAILVVVNTWQYRNLVAEKKHNEVRIDQLNTRWSQLILERQARSTPSEIEKMARKRLGMVSPSKQQVRYLVLQ